MKLLSYEKHSILALTKSSMGNSQKLLEASRTGDLDLVRKLLDKIRRNSTANILASFRSSANINARDLNGYTPLHHACLNGHTDIVRLLLAHGSPTDVLDKRGAMPLYWAAWAGHDEIVQMLLMQPRTVPNLNAQTYGSETALHCAAQHGHTATLAILLECGADPTIRNSSFQTALDLAAQFGRLEAVETLINTHPVLLNPFKQVDVAVDNSYLSNRRATHTHTCLHLASRNGHQKVVETLLNAGVNVNVLTHAGTALHEAAFNGKKSVVKCLLYAGVNPHAKNGTGRTAVELLADYPTTLSNEIIAIIKGFCKQNLAIQPHLQDLQDMNDENQNCKRLANKNKLHLKSHTKYSEVPMNSLSGARSTPLLENLYYSSELSKSFKSLAEASTTDAFYLPMRPSTINNHMHENNATSVFKPVLTSSCSSSTTSFSAKVCDRIEANKKNSLKGDEYVNICTSGTDCKCEDYVEMSAQRSSASSSKHLAEEKSTPTNLTSKVCESALNPITNHAATPEIPPPSVQQAESEIFQLMRFKSLRNPYQDYETLAMEKDELASRASLNSRSSDYVEEFEADIPFAGLFKGSSLALANVVEPSENIRPLYEFNENEVWDQINTIFESIGKEVSTVNDDLETSLVQAKIKMRCPSDLILGVPHHAATKWRHGAKALINNEISYKLYYLGSTVIRNLQGTLSTRQSIQKLKRDNASLEREDEVSLLRDCSNSTKILKAHNKETRLQVGIALSYAGVKFIDHENKFTMCLHAIENINCVCQDAEDLRHFAYITKEDELHYCHVFMVDDESLATEIILTLAQAFEIAYQMALYEKKSSIQSST